MESVAGDFYFGAIGEFSSGTNTDQPACFRRFSLRGLDKVRGGVPLAPHVEHQAVAE